VDGLCSLVHANRRIFRAADGIAFDTGQLRTGVPATYKPQCRCPPNGRGPRLSWNKRPSAGNRYLLRLRNPHPNRGTSMSSEQIRDGRTTVSPWFPRGVRLLHDPALNKGTAFSDAERDMLGLKGLLPPHVCSQEEQVARVMENFRRLPSALEKYIFMTALRRCSSAS
jgi:hypothetical protein